MAGVSSVARRLYLSIYNWVLFFGWAQVLYCTIWALLGSAHETVYAAIERPLLLAQTAASLELLHCVTVNGEVSTLRNLSTTCRKVVYYMGYFVEFSRGTHSHFLVIPLALSWSIAETIRYSFFGLKEAFGVAPSWLLWLRYNTFVVLYPVGLISEVGLYFVALPYMKSYLQTSKTYSLRVGNFSFNLFYASTVAIALYIPGFPHNYRYMRGRREKVLSKAKIA
ncbi:hypothetical protein ACP4OV_022037 [Aristida adscensionis]